MKRVGAYEAKTHFSQLLDEVEGGEVVEITRRGKPVVRMTRAPRNTPEEIEQSWQKWDRYRDEHNITLGGLSIREMIEEGRRY